MRLAILNVYSPTNTAADTAKSTFQSSLNKAKKELDKKPKYKSATIGGFNATISSQSKESGAWEPILGHSDSDRIEPNDNGERILAWCLQNNMK